MNKQTEALKLAEDALKHVRTQDMELVQLSMIALAAIREALAEQPAQGCDYCNHPQYAGTKCKNCGWLQPAQPQQEPVANYPSYCCQKCGEQIGWLGRVMPFHDCAPYPAQPHPDDVAVDLFAEAMKAKMAKQRAKGYGGWDDPAACPTERLQQMLVDHIAKGDPVDVANFAMMLWSRGERTEQPAQQEPVTIGEPVGWHSKQYGFVYMALQPHQFEVGSTLCLKNGTPAWRIESSCSMTALISMSSLPHGTVFYTSPPAQPAQRKPWVGLTDVEWMNIVNKDHAWFGQRPEDVAHEVAKLVEAKLKEKNT